MRLLQCDNRGSIIFTKDFINDVPQFAILSHTWGPDTEEVSFRDILDGHATSRVGFDKLQFCKEKAKADHLQYFWVDTCCIDKWSSTELAEAINSMFKWYRDATKCYVYLSDVSRFKVDVTEESDFSHWESQFRASRWFTRGWTLQELIAPVSVDFFSKEGDYLGNKRLLEKVIHEITGIPLEALRKDRSLQDFSIDERLLWVEKRDTTRQEDAAYCLLGIFDIHIPLIYGEGKQKAMNRLLREAKDTQDRLLVPFKNPRVDFLTRNATPQSKIFTSSFNDAPTDLLSIYFMERKHEMSRIQEAYQDCEEDVPTRFALWGIPGVGKTQLALRYTKVFLNEATVSAVFWMSCSNIEKLHQGFSRLLNVINHPDQFKLEHSARMVAARRWLEQSEVSGIFSWLLVLDNVDITTLDFLRENLPRQGRRGQILFTTRTEAIAHAVCKVSGKLRLSIELEPPTIGDALTFFLKSVGISEETISSTGRGQATELLQCLGRLPFAIEHAASFITQSSQSIESFVRLYQGDQRSYIFDWRNLFSAYEAKSVSEIFRSQLDDLKQSNPEICSLLNILVFWDPDRIDFKTIKAGALFLGTSLEPVTESSRWNRIWHWTYWFMTSFIKSPYFGLTLFNKIFSITNSLSESEETSFESHEREALIEMISSEVQLQSALQQLQMFSLIKRRSSRDGGVYTMHDLTQALMQANLEAEGTHLQWLRRAVRMACGVFRQLKNPTLPENWNQCEGLISHILSLQKYSESVGYQDANLLKARSNIAMYWVERGRYHEASKTYEQLLGTSSDILHNYGIETTQWELGLAEVNWHLTNHSESTQLYREVQQKQELRLGPDHPDVLQIKEKLALVYRSQARYTEARSMLEHVLESREADLGPNHLDTAQATENLAMIINEQAEAEDNKVLLVEAETLHKQAYACRKAQLGPNHLDSLWSYDNIGTNYRAQGRQQEAVEIHEEVLERRTARLGEEHPQVLYTVANLASAYTFLGRLDEAEVMYKRAIASNEQKLGHDHSQTLWVVEGLADVHLQQSEMEKARDLYDRALRGMQDRLGIRHPSYMRLMHKQANLYRDWKDLPKSITLYKELLALRKAEQRSTNPELLRTYDDAATAHISANEYEEAEECYRLELEGIIEEFGSQHNETKKREQKLARFLADRESHRHIAGGGVEGATRNEESSSNE